MYTVQDIQKVLNYLQSRDVKEFNINFDHTKHFITFTPVNIDTNFLVSLSSVFNTDTQNRESRVTVIENRVL